MSHDTFTLLRSLLKTFGLPSLVVDEIVDWIKDFLAEKDRGSKPEAQGDWPYRVREDFLSPAEYNFYLVLKPAAGDQFVVCPKVNLGDLFYAKSSEASQHSLYTNKINRKHVDFLLCDPESMRPLAGVELDDKSHQRSDRQARDKFVESVFQAAGLPLVRIPVRRSYAVNELREQLGAVLIERAPPPAVPKAKQKGSAPAVMPAAEPHSTRPPICPKCGGGMVLRTAKVGSNAGEQFWGCQDYPRCRGITKYAPQGRQ